MASYFVLSGRRQLLIELKCCSELDRIRVGVPLLTHETTNKTDDDVERRHPLEIVSFAQHSCCRVRSFPCSLQLAELFFRQVVKRPTAQDRQRPIIRSADRIKPCN